jgi:hypothetical protein
LPCWMRRPLPAQDDGNPFGKAMRQHGAHTAAWPSTPRQWRADERRVERVRRSLERSCWRRPRAWSWHGSPGGRNAGSTRGPMIGQEPPRAPTSRAVVHVRGLNASTKTAATAPMAPITRGRAQWSQGKATTRLHCQAWTPSGRPGTEPKAM